MSLARIKEQAEKANQMIEGLKVVPQETENAPETETEVAVEQPVEDQGVASSQPSTTDESEPSADFREQAELWEQRYRSLDGMIKSRDRQIQQLHDLLAGMQQMTQQKPAEQDAETPILTKKDEEDFGAELVDMARRAAREEFRSLKADIAREINELRNNLTNVTEVTQGTVQDRFEAQLDNFTEKRWRILDSDTKFIEWLKARPARQKTFIAGVQEQDATTVADFFNEYAALANQQREQAEVPKNTRKTELEKQVAPGKSKSVSAPDSQASSKKIWTRTEIAQAYSNKKQYKADEFQQMERDIATAQREGRVDFNR
jgi:hypothetical protein